MNIPIKIIRKKYKNFKNIVKKMIKMNIHRNRILKFRKLIIKTKMK